MPHRARLQASVVGARQGVVLGGVEPKGYIWQRIGGEGNDGGTGTVVEQLERKVG